MIKWLLSGWKQAQKDEEIKRCSILHGHGEVCGWRWTKKAKIFSAEFISSDDNNCKKGSTAPATNTNHYWKVFPRFDMKLIPMRLHSYFLGLFSLGGVRLGLGLKVFVSPTSLADGFQTKLTPRCFSVRFDTHFFRQFRTHSFCLRLPFMSWWKNFSGSYRSW